MKTKVPELRCKRCQHSWVPRISNVRICPRCKSPYWDKEPIRKIKGKGEVYTKIRGNSMYGGKYICTIYNYGTKIEGGARYATNYRYYEVEREIDQHDIDSAIQRIISRVESRILMDLERVTNLGEKYYCYLYNMSTHIEARLECMWGVYSISEEIGEDGESIAIQRLLQRADNKEYLSA